MSNNFHLQLYRGTTAQNDAYTGLSGEVTVDTTLSKLRLHDGSTAGGVEIGGMPVGSIIPYAGTTIPAGYLLCDGSAISRTTYSALFASIGTTYGEGDGNSTFNIPNLIGYVPLGMDDEYIGQYCPGVLPDIQGSLTPILVFGNTTDANGCFKSSGNPMVNMRTGSEIASFGGASIEFKASDYNSIYSSYNWFGGERVIPASLGIKYIIKYNV